jgi:hypothetical protein
LQMADISIISRLVQGFQRNVDISQNSLVVGSIKIGTSSPVEITKAIATKLIAVQAAADSDGTFDTRYNTKSALASTSTGQGAALVGIEDAGTYFTGDTVEEALQQLGASIGSGAAEDVTYDNSTSGLTATNVQDAIDEVEGRVDATEIVANAAIPLAQKGANNGVATLDSGGKIPSAQLPNTVMEYKGNWNASTNNPSLADGAGNSGDVYRVNVAGTQNLGSGSQTFAVGDWVVYNGSIWEKSINSNSVGSVNGQTGTVVLDTDDISEGSTNKYFSTELAQDAVGGALVDTATIDFTYDDVGNQITADVKDNSINANKLTTSVADQQTITGGNGSALAVQESPILARMILAGESLADDVTFALRLAINGETAGRMYKADNDATTLNNFFVQGLARKVGGASAGDSIRVVMAGRYVLGANDTPFSGSDIGKPVYLGASGALTITPPSSANLAAFRVGIVESTTSINVDRQLHGIN